MGRLPWRIARALAILSLFAIGAAAYRAWHARPTGPRDCASEADCGGGPCVMRQGADRGRCGAAAPARGPCDAPCARDADCDPACRCRKREGKENGRCFPASSSPPAGYVQGDPEPAGP